MLHKPFNAEPSGPTTAKPGREDAGQAGPVPPGSPALAPVDARSGSFVVLAMDTVFGAAALAQFRREAPDLRGAGLTALGVPPIWSGIHRFVGETLMACEAKPPGTGGRVGRRMEPFVVVLGDDGVAGDPQNPCLVSTFAWNEAEIGARDLLGQIPAGRRLEPAGPAFRQSVVPVKPALEALRNAGIAALRAKDCGHGLSNALFYTVLGRGLHRALWLSSPDAVRAGSAMAVVVAAMVGRVLAGRKAAADGMS